MPATLPVNIVNWDEGAARYAMAMRRGIVFSAASQAATAISAGLALVYTGVMLYNPVGSDKVLIPCRVGWAHSVAPVGIATIGLISGSGNVPSATTPLTVRSNEIGTTPTAAGLAYSAATVTGFVWHHHLRDGFTAGALPPPVGDHALEGVWGLAPGSYLAIGALTAVTGLGSISWVELPYP